ncbi:aminotransferase [Infundibulicybe gibba]|nr:aminotransferase [Infundibulicybe gibba]
MFPARIGTSAFRSRRCLGTSSLAISLESALRERKKSGVSLYNGVTPLPDRAPDFFSNDYLSLSSYPHLREGLLKRFHHSPNLFGSRGSRVLTGTTSYHVDLEDHLRNLFGAQAAMIFNSGYMANISFLGSVPQTGDVILHDEFIHASCHDGMRVSRARSATYSFSHNSVSSFEERLKDILKQHPQITHGKSTIFIVLESLYSMDGDFCPITEIIEMAERYVPSKSLHIVVDEAHSVGLFGPRGKGFLAHLNLTDRVHTIIHPLTKAPNYIGAVLLSSPIICHYIMNYSRPTIFSTSLPYADITAIRFCFDTITSPFGDELRDKLHHRARFFSRTALELFQDVPSNLLSLRQTRGSEYTSTLASPIFAVLTSLPASLQAYLNEKGYSAQAFSFPAVPRGEARLRVTVHAGNTEEDIREFVLNLRQWALDQHRVRASTEPF